MFHVTIIFNFSGNILELDVLLAHFFPYYLKKNTSMALQIISIHKI